MLNILVYHFFWWVETPHGWQESWLELLFGQAHDENLACQVNEGRHWDPCRAAGLGADFISPLPSPTKKNKGIETSLKIYERSVMNDLLIAFGAG